MSTQIIVILSLEVWACPSSRYLTPTKADFAWRTKWWHNPIEAELSWASVWIKCIGFQQWKTQKKNWRQRATHFAARVDVPENYTVFLTNPHIWHAIHFANEIKFPAVLTLIENPLMKIETAEAEGFHSGLLRVFLMLTKQASDVYSGLSYFKY